jgi:hypothetical protein
MRLVSNAEMSGVGEIDTGIKPTDKPQIASLFED